MAEILTFGHKWSGDHQRPAGSDAPYAIDLALGSGVLWSETLAAAPAIPSARDWTNQELADLYRAVTLLGQSGIALEIDRGLSDEGDPWLVLCRADGEVFIHFCRIAGRYLLDSPALENCLRGFNFASLIDQFVASVAPAARPSNVIALRNSKVLLHPASMLAALIWSLYLLSDAALGQAHASEFGAAPQLDANVDGDATLAPIDTTTLIIDSLIAGQDLATGHPAVLEKLLAPLADNQNLVASGPVSTGAQFLAALSALALGVGFINTHLLTSIEPTGSHSSARDDVAPTNAPAILVTAALTATDTDLPPITSVSSDASDASTVVPDDVNAATVPDSLTAQGVQIIHRHPSTAPHLSPAAEAVVALQDDQSAAPSSTASAATATPSASPESHLATITQELDYFRSVASFGDLASYSVRGIDVRASFDVSALPFSNTDPIGSLLPQPDQISQIEPVAKPSSDLYSDSIRSFIDFLLNSGPDVELIASLDDIVLVDMSALDELTDTVYSRSWTFEDGGRIIAIGHMEMFASFGLA